MTYLVLQILLFVLLALLVGALLTWLFFVRPLRARLARTQERVTTAERTTAGLRTELDERRAGADADAAEAVSARQARGTLESEVAQLRTGFSDQQQEAFRLRARLSTQEVDCQDQLERVRHELGGITAASALPAASVVTLTATAERPAAVRTVAPASEDAQSSKDDNDVRPDDLKRISGVGPVLERKLHGLGIRTFRQVATLTPDDVQRVGAELREFGDRAERDDWVRQARDLHQSKYGERL